MGFNGRGQRTILYLLKDIVHQGESLIIDEDGGYRQNVTSDAHTVREMVNWDSD
jgi:hypothetical protein